MNKAFYPHCNNEVSYHVIKETIKDYKVDILQNMGVSNICRI